MAKRLADTKLFPPVMTLIAAVGRSISKKDLNAGNAFKTGMEQCLAAAGGNAGNFLVPHNDDEETPKWMNLLTEGVADHLVANDFIKDTALKIALSNVIKVYTEGLKKPKAFEELLYLEIGDCVDGFSEFEPCFDEDPDTVEVEDSDEQETEIIDGEEPESDTEEDEEEDSLYD